MACLERVRDRMGHPTCLQPIFALLGSASWRTYHLHVADISSISGVVGDVSNAEAFWKELRLSST